MIQLDPQARNLMNTDARQAFPDECCGFMFGKEDAQGNRVVSDALPVINSSAENRRRRFVIAPMDYLRGEQYADDRGLQLLGIYHSHPNHPAEPSEHDRVAAQPWFSYVIISVGEEGIRDTRSWVLNESSRFDEEKVASDTTEKIDN